MRHCLDEATAAAEAMTMIYGLYKGKSHRFFVSQACHPQTIAVIKTRALPLAIEVIVGDHTSFDFTNRANQGCLALCCNTRPPMAQL
jgi:glycine dehydrogenase